MFVIVESRAGGQDAAHQAVVDEPEDSYVRPSKERLRAQRRLFP